MRVLVISDMEGVAGITRWNQVSAGEDGYAEGRVLYTEEINAAVRGALAGGADEVVVMDCHGAGGEWSFASLIPDRLDPRCEFVVQQRWTEYTEALEDGCDAALLVAMHARAGTADGVLSHTVRGSEWQELRFNGRPVGETAINAALCGHWDCPVLLVTGDRAACREALDLLGPGLTTVEVKRAHHRFGARHIPPVRARELIEAGARSALANLRAVAPYVPARPVEIAVELRNPEHADPYRARADVERTGPRSIRTTAPDWWTAWQRLEV